MSAAPFKLRAKDAKPGSTLHIILLENEKLERQRDEAVELLHETMNLLLGKDGAPGLAHLATQANRGTIDHAIVVCVEHIRAYLARVGKDRNP